MECKLKDNLKNCNCSFSCGRKGLCCECVAYHRAKGELPACYFNDDEEKSGDRTVGNYLRQRRELKD